jgi:hypothetical protein
MRPLVLPIAALMLANAPAAFAQEDPSTAGIFAPGQSGMIEPRKALKPSANENGATGAGIVPAGRPTISRPGQTVVRFPGQGPVTLPDQPAVSVSGPAVPGQSLPLSVNPIPIPGQPGLGSAVVNGRSAIIQMGTNRIMRYAN